MDQLAISIDFDWQFEFVNKTEKGQMSPGCVSVVNVNFIGIADGMRACTGLLWRLCAVLVCLGASTGLLWGLTFTPYAEQLLVRAGVPRGSLMQLRSGRTLEYRVFGEQSAPRAVLLALHGFTTTGAWFAPHEELARSRGVMIVAPSLPGWGATHGRSGASFEHAAEDVTELLEHLGVTTKVHLSGTSLGASFAVETAALMVDRIASLHLIVPTVPGHHDRPVFFASWVLKLVTYPPFNRIVPYFVLPLIEPLIEPWSERILEFAFHEDEWYNFCGDEFGGECQMFLEDFSYSTSMFLEGFAEAGVMLQSSETYHAHLDRVKEQLGDRLHIYYGECDQLTPKENAFYLKERCQDASITKFEGGHMTSASRAMRKVLQSL